MLWRFSFLGLALSFLAAEEPAAGVLASVAGSVTVTEPGGHTGKAHVFDWLKVGATIRTEAGARVLVVLENGARYELGERVSAKLERGNLHVVAGDVRRLPGLTEIPKLAAIADTVSTKHGGVVRIRGPKLQHCYPVANAAILSNQPTFSFQPITGVTSYVIEIENEEGKVVQRRESPGTPVTLPAGVLNAGSMYYWEARGVEPQGDGPQCGGEFSVLAAQDEERRAAFKTAVQNSGDADSLALLAEIDWRLGLLREAQGEFTAALQGTSAPEGIRSALLQIDALMR
jgi:hypothetical protein